LIRKDVVLNYVCRVDGGGIPLELPGMTVPGMTVPGMTVPGMTVPGRKVECTGIACVKVGLIDDKTSAGIDPYRESYPQKNSTKTFHQVGSVLSGSATEELGQE